MARATRELKDEQWEVLRPLLPRQRGPGRRWRDHRQVIEAVFWQLRTGAPWRDLPVEYGPWQTAYERFLRWREDGTWDQFYQKLLSRLAELEQIDWTLLCIDGSNIRGSRAAAGAGKKGA